MLAKYPDGMLNRFVTNSSLRLQMEGVNDIKVSRVDREEGYCSSHADDY